MSLRRILAVSKRATDRCANQALLDAAGLTMLTTDNLEAAFQLAEGDLIQGVIVCHDSWSEAERERIGDSLKAARVPIISCPGCVGYEETTGKPGALDMLLPITGLIELVADSKSN